MKILHCFFSFNVGGAESMLVDIMNEQSKNHKVILLVLNNRYDDSLLKKINKKIDIKLFNRKQGSKSILPIVKLNHYIWRLHPDVVHVHTYSLVPAIRITPPNYCLTVHDVGIPNTYFNRFNTIFAISNAVKEDIESKGHYNVKLIANGVNVPKIKPKSEFGSKNTFRIVQVANLIGFKKGQDILIKALSIVIYKYHISNVTVDFIGYGDSLSELEELARKLDIEKNINFLGKRDRDYIYAHLCDYNLMCHPSRFEGFGLVVAEGMAAKIPVLVSIGDGPFEIIERGKYGYYFERENAEDCAAQIVDIYQNYENRSLIVGEAYQHVLQEYSVEKTAQRYLEEYKNELKEQKR